jgi:hypothetical protein
MKLTDAKMDQMVLSVQQFVSRILNGDTIIKLTFEQLASVLDISGQELKEDTTAIVRLQENLMLVGISLISLPTIQKASDEQKPKKHYYLFRDNHSAFEDAIGYNDEEFIFQLKDRSTTFVDIKNLERLNLPLEDIAPMVCKSIGHSRLSTSKHGKCIRCQQSLKATEFTVVLDQSGKVGISQSFRPIDRLDWRDLVFVSPKKLNHLSKYKKFDKVVDVSNCFQLIEKAEEVILDDDQKSRIFKSVMKKKSIKDKQ